MTRIDIDTCERIVSGCTKKIRSECGDDDTDDYLIKLERLIIANLNLIRVVKEDENN